MQPGLIAPAGQVEFQQSGQVQRNRESQLPGSRQIALDRQAEDVAEVEASDQEFAPSQWPLDVLRPGRVLHTGQPSRNRLG